MRWLRWRKWDCVGALSTQNFNLESGVGAFAWPSAADHVAHASTHDSGSIRQLSLQSQTLVSVLQSKFLPSFRERYSPPNPESASIGRNLGWRNSKDALTALCICNASCVEERSCHNQVITELYIQRIPHRKWCIQISMQNLVLDGITRKVIFMIP